MKKVVKIGIIIYGVFIFGIAFMLLGGPQFIKEKNTEIKTDQGYMDQSTGTLDPKDCSKGGFCLGDRVELSDRGVKAGMLPINGTIIKITDKRILTVLMVSDKTDEETSTIISEDWVQHIRPKDMNESNNAQQVMVQATDNSEE
jgi:hypothetical protein